MSVALVILGDADVARVQQRSTGFAGGTLMTGFRRQLVHVVIGRGIHLGWLELVDRGDDVFE